MPKRVGERALGALGRPPASAWAHFLEREDEQVNGMASWRERPRALAWQPPARAEGRGPCGVHVGPDCSSYPEAGHIPSRPSVQKQDRLGMKSQAGRGLGWGCHSRVGPGVTTLVAGSQEGRMPSVRKLGKTHTQQRREGGKKTNSWRPKLAWSSAWAADSWGPTPRCRQLTAWQLRDPPRPSPKRPSAGGAWTWTGEGGWAWGAKGPTALGEHRPSQVP